MALSNAKCSFTNIPCTKIHVFLNKKKIVGVTVKLGIFAEISKWLTYTLCNKCNIYFINAFIVNKNLFVFLYNTIILYYYSCYFMILYFSAAMITRILKYWYVEIT